MMASIASQKQDEEALRLAVRKRDLEAVKRLIDKGADVNAKDRNDKTPLNIAVILEYVEIAQLLIEKGADVNAKDRRGITPLQNAVMNKRIDLIKLMVDAGADIDVKDDLGTTALHRAVIYGPLEIAQLLIGKGADVNAKDLDGRTPLHVAVMYRKLDMIKLLLEKGANLEAKDRFGATPFLLTKNLQIAEMLIKAGANLEVKDKGEGMTSLHFAVRDKDVAFAKLLVDAGADINAKDPKGRTPLLLATYYKNVKLDMIKLLVDAGADINAKDNFGTTALKMVVQLELIDMIKLFIEKGADIDAKDDLGRTPLHAAVKEDMLYALKLLIEKGAKVDVGDEDGRTPLYYAVQREGLKSAKLLIDAGADVNLGQPLLEVATLGNVAIARLLIQNGADMNARQSSTGKTALHYAAEYGQPEIAQLLAKSGADVTIRDSEGKLFWEYAEDEDFREKMEAIYEAYPVSDRAKKLSELRGSGGSSKEIEELSKMSDKEFEELVGGRAMDKCTNDMDHLFLGTWEASDFRNTVFLRVTDKFGKQRTYCMVERFYEGEEYRGKRTPDIDANISSAFKDIFFSDWVYKYDAGSEAELREMRKVMEEEEEAEREKEKILKKKTFSLMDEKMKLEKEVVANYSPSNNSTKFLELVEKTKKKREEFEKAKDEHFESRILLMDRETLQRLQNKANRTAEEEAELLELGKRFNGLSDKEHKAGDAYSSADAYGRSGKAGRPGQKRYVVIKLTNGVDFYVEWDDLLKEVVKRKRGFVDADTDSYYSGRREADVTSFKLPDKWSLPIAIYIKQEEKPVAIGNEEGSSGSSETHGNRTVSVYKVRRIVNFETYDSIDRQRECLGEDCGLLHKALESNESEKDIYANVESLIKKGEDVNYMNEVEYPLHAAVTKQLLSVTRLLLENGANVNAKDWSGTTALHVACKMKNINIVKMLIEYGADLNLQDSDGWTALHIAADKYEIAEFLIRKGADPTIKTEYGKTFFDIVPDVKVRERMEKVFAEVRRTKRKRKRPADSLADGVDKLKF